MKRRTSSSSSSRVTRVLPAASTRTSARQRRSSLRSAQVAARTSTWSRLARRQSASTKSGFPAANYEKKEEKYDNDLSTHYESIRHRAQQIEVASEHLDLLVKADFGAVSEIARDIIARYERAEIDAVYIVYNEFKSVISAAHRRRKTSAYQSKLGANKITDSEEMTQEQRDAAAKAAESEGISVHEPDNKEAEEEAKKFGTCRCRLHLRPVTRRYLRPSPAALRHHADLPRPARKRGRRTRRPYDGNRCRHEERRRPDRLALADHEPAFVRQRSPRKLSKL